MEKTDGSGNDESDSKLEEHSAKINKLEREVEQQSGEIKKLKKRFEELQTLNSNLVEEQTKTAQHTIEIKDLKKDWTEVQQTNNILVEELNEQKKTNEQMKEDLIQVQQTNINLKKQLDEQRKTNDEIMKGNCKLKVGNICYFAVIHDVVYNKAVNICKKRNADVGLIRDKESYNVIMNDLRKNIPKRRTLVRI
uniref:uncharacterized protein PFB0765w-like n=1 Tax=Styela clava TaxID=7725 RepID=UPI00193A4023|nr:uncharacterized protein PFB0765w-like [Styela clava]